jgi:hypothetical protein
VTTNQPADQQRRCKRPGCDNDLPARDRGRPRVFCGDDCARKYANASRPARPQAPAGQDTDALADLELLLSKATALARRAAAQTRQTDPARVRVQLADAEAARRRAEAAAQVAHAQAAGQAHEAQAASEALDAARKDLYAAQQDAARHAAQTSAARADLTAARDQHAADQAKTTAGAAAAITAAQHAAEQHRHDAATAIKEAKDIQQRADTEVARARQAETDARAEIEHTRADAARERDTLTASHHAQLNAAEKLIAAQHARAERAEHQIDSERTQNRLSTTPRPDPATSDTHPSPGRQRNRTRAAG